MAAVSLTDQLGAVAVIDGMRHRTLVVNEHLNLRERRAEAAAKIQAYYQSQGVTVDGEIVERGVSEYFDRRLTFEAPRLGFWTSKLATAYITRRRWRGPAAGIFLACGAIIVSGVLLHRHRQESALLDLKGKVVQVEATRTRQAEEIQQISRSLDALAAEAGAAGITAGNRIAKTAQDTLAGAKTRLDAMTVPRVTAETMAIDRQRVEGLATAAVEIDQPIRIAATKQKELRELLDANGRLGDLEHLADFKNVAGKFLAVATSTQLAREAIASADASGVPAAVTAVSSALDAYSRVGQLGEAERAARAIEQEFAAMHLTDSERSVVATLASAFTSAVGALDQKAAAAALNDYRQLLAFAKTPVTLNITNRPGVKSGVERNYKASGGKTWYLIVDVTDPAGRLVPMLVRNSENSRQAFASTFGVRVDSAEYQRVKSEKQKDGHIRDRQIGSKPAGSLVVKFGARTSESPDLITAW